VSIAARLQMKISLCFVVYVIDLTTLFACSQKSKISLSNGNAIFVLNASNVAQTNILMKTISKMG
jgi:hypothetical protein